MTQCRLKLPVEEDVLESKLVLALAFRLVAPLALGVVAPLALGVVAPLTLAGEHRFVGSLSHACKSFPVQHAVNAKSLASSAVSCHELEVLTVCVCVCE